MIIDSDKCKLMNLRLHNDEEGYYLSACYEHEDDFGKYITTIPRIILPINYYAPSISIEHSVHVRGGDTYIDLGFGDLLLGRGKDGYNYITKTIEKKVKKMTLSEIEKKLGYKIELVSGEE